MNKEKTETEQSEEPAPLNDATRLVLEKLQGDPLKLMAGLAQIEKHSGSTILLSVPSDDHATKGAYGKFAEWWFGAEGASTPFHISCALEEFINALMNKEQPHIQQLLQAVRTAYKSAEALPVKGKNRYDSDLNRLDNRYIRRQRR